jgi:hypothetical protein
MLNGPDPPIIFMRVVLTGLVDCVPGLEQKSVGKPDFYPPPHAVAPFSQYF